jgi:hypothetical protein
MNLLILGGPVNAQTNPLYRGTYRTHPGHCDELPDSHEINKLYSWFREEGAVVRNRSKALRFAELWNARLKGSQGFEVVEVIERGQHSQGQFIGFDLSASFSDSLLAWGLRQYVKETSPCEVLCDLISRHYAPQLNQQGLFQTVEVASLCLHDMCALQDLCPQLFVIEGLRAYRPVGLFSLTSINEV